MRSIMSLMSFYSIKKDSKLSSASICAAATSRVHLYLMSYLSIQLTGAMRGVACALRARTSCNILMPGRTEI